jgi:hypothetical protein
MYRKVVRSVTAQISFDLDLSITIFGLMPSHFRVKAFRKIICFELDLVSSASCFVILKKLPLLILACFFLSLACCAIILTFTDGCRKGKGRLSVGSCARSENYENSQKRHRDWCAAMIVPLNSCLLSRIMMPHRHCVDPALDPILLRYLNQYYLTPDAVSSVVAMPVFPAPSHPADRLP